MKLDTWSQDVKSVLAIAEKKNNQEPAEPALMFSIRNSLQYSAYIL